MLLDLATRRFWCASYFVRRSPDRNPELAIKVLEQIAADAESVTLHDRAINLLVEIDNNEHRRSNEK